MKSKVLSRQLIFLVGILLITFSFIVIFFMNYWGLEDLGGSIVSSGGKALGFVSNQSVESIFGLPVRLRIPKIDVDAPFVYVALASDGAIGAPERPSDVAWFNLSSRPGENGSAVVSGHYGWKDGIPAVFDNLNKLKKGDRIDVEDKNGAVTIFVVRESRNYDENADATAVFDSQDGKSHLNLITCEGVWSKANKSYSGRLVVFADKE